MRAHWKAILAIVGISIPALFNFVIAKLNSDEAKIRAEVAYVTMQDVVKDLQEQSYTQALQIARLEGQQKCAAASVGVPEKLSSMSRRPPEPEKPAPPVLDDADGDGLSDNVPMKMRPKPPQSFNQAVDDFKAKK